MTRTNRWLMVGVGLGLAASAHAVDPTTCEAPYSSKAFVQAMDAAEAQVSEFEIDAFRKHCLLNGLDDIGLTMEKASKIDTFETGTADSRPWA